MDFLLRFFGLRLGALVSIFVFLVGCGPSGVEPFSKYQEQACDWNTVLEPMVFPETADELHEILAILNKKGSMTIASAGTVVAK